MADLSRYSTEDLMGMLDAPQPSPLSSYSTEQLMGMLEEPEQGIGSYTLSEAKRGVMELPSTLAQTPKALGGLASDIGSTISSPIDSISSGAAERTARAVGGISSAYAGGVGGAAVGAAGGPLAPVTVPLGAAIGAGLGYLGFSKLNQLTGSDEPTTLKEDVGSLSYGLAQDAATLGAAKTAKGFTKGARAAKTALKTRRGIQTLASEADKLRPVTAPNTITGGLRSAAELSGDPGLQRAEVNIRRLVPEFADDVEGVRISDRAAALKEVFPEGGDDLSRGQIFREEIAAARKGEKRQVNSLYDKIKTERDIPVDRLAEDVVNALDDLVPDVSRPNIVKSSKKISPAILEFQEQLFDLGVSGEKISAEELRAMRSRIRGLGRDATGADIVAAKKLEDILNAQVERLPDGNPIKEADLANRRFKELYDEKFGASVNKKSKFGRYQKNASALPKEAFSSPENTLQAVKMAKGSSAAHDALTSHVAEQIASKVENVSSGQGGSAALRWWKSNRPKYAPGLSSDDLAVFDDVFEDVRSARDKFEASRAGSRGVSPTTALKNYDEYLKRQLGGKIGDAIAKGSGAAKTLGVALGGYLGLSGGYVTAIVSGDLGRRIGGKISDVAAGRRISEYKQILKALEDPEEFNRILGLDEKAIKARRNITSRDILGAQVMTKGGRENDKKVNSKALFENMRGKRKKAGSSAPDTGGQSEKVSNPEPGERAKQLIKTFESLRLTPYEDTGGVQTIGYGHIGSAAKKKKITRDEAERLFSKDFAKHASIVSKEVKVPLSQDQSDALASLVYNIGPTAFAGSTLLKKLNAGDYSGAAEEFDRWVYDNGKKVRGLENRRQREKGLFLKGLMEA